MASAAQPAEHKVIINVDVRAARRKLKSLQSLAREAGIEFAKLDEQLAELETRAEALAAYGIKLEVSSD